MTPAPVRAASAEIVREHLLRSRDQRPPTDITRIVKDVTVLGDRERLHREREVRAQLLGAGSVLQPLLDDPNVTDVLVNGSDGVWVDRGHGLQRAQVRVADPRALATRLATISGQRLDNSVPVVDGRLPDGSRLHAVLDPIAAQGAHISIRTLRRRAFTVPDLQQLRFLDAIAAQVLRRLVEVRANVLVSGATGCGKTSLLACALSLVPATERIICIEEAAELAPNHPHVVHLQVRRPNVQGAGGIGLETLVRTAMRMRPDRLVLGECRGPEVRDVLGALNTGHDGGWATVHANSADDVPARLVALGALADMAPDAVAVQARAAFDAVLHLRRDATGTRVLSEVAVLTQVGSQLVCQPALLRRGDAMVTAPGWEQLAAALDRGRT